MANWTLTEWRATLCDVLNVESTGYSRERQDRAIRSAAGEFRRLAEVGRTTDQTLTTTSGSAALACSGVSGFTADGLVYAKILDSTVYYPLTVIPTGDYYHCQAYNQSSGRPETISFETETSALLWPKPDATYYVKLVFVPPLYSGTWTIGQASGASVTIAIDERFAPKVVELGAAPLLSYEDPIRHISSQANERFIAYCRSVRDRNRPPMGMRIKDVEHYL
jgi:hypothetical protein